MKITAWKQKLAPENQILYSLSRILEMKLGTSRIENLSWNFEFKWNLDFRISDSDFRILEMEIRFLD